MTCAICIILNFISYLFYTNLKANMNFADSVEGCKINNNFIF